MYRRGIRCDADQHKGQGLAQNNTTPYNSRQANKAWTNTAQHNKRQRNAKLNTKTYNVNIAQHNAVPLSCSAAHRGGTTECNATYQIAYNAYN